MALYSDKVMDHFQNPRNVGKMDDADGVGEVGNAKCGDIMKMYIKVNDGIITDVKFNTFGCGSAIATSSMARLSFPTRPLSRLSTVCPRTRYTAPSSPRRQSLRQSRITMTATVSRTIPSCSAKSCMTASTAQSNLSIKKPTAIERWS